MFPYIFCLMRLGFSLSWQNQLHDWLNRRQMMSTYTQLVILVPSFQPKKGRNNQHNSHYPQNSQGSRRSSPSIGRASHRGVFGCRKNENVMRMIPEMIDSFNHPQGLYNILVPFLMKWRSFFPGLFKEGFIIP